MTAWQAALDGEYACLYAYGAAGALLADDERGTAVLYEGQHRTSRDQLRQWIIDDGGEPQAPSPAYALPDTTRRARVARRTLAEVELRLIPLYLQLVAETMGDVQRKTWVMQQIQACGGRAAIWGAPSQAFPWPADLPLAIT